MSSLRGLSGQCLQVAQLEALSREPPSSVPTPSIWALVREGGGGGGSEPQVEGGATVLSVLRVREPRDVQI